jgi:hexokinase
MSDKKKFNLSMLPETDQAIKTDDDIPNIGTMAFEKLPAPLRCTLYLRQQIADLQSQANKLTSMLEDKNTELRDKIENKDTELRNTIENKNAELREISEKMNTALRDQDSVEIENKKLKKICLATAAFAFISFAYTIVESALTLDIPPLKLVSPLIPAIAAIYGAVISYGRDKNPDS